MLDNTNVGKLIAQTTHSFIDQYYEDENIQSESKSRLAELLAPELRALRLGDSDVIAFMAGEAVEQDIKKRHQINQSSGQSDMFAYQNHFVTFANGKEGYMANAEADTVNAHREREIKNIRNVHNRFESNEAIREKILPVMEANPGMTVKQAMRKLGSLE